MRRLWNLDKNADFRLRIAATSGNRTDSGLFLRRVDKDAIASSTEKSRPAHAPIMKLVARGVSTFTPLNTLLSFGGTAMACK